MSPRRTGPGVISATLPSTGQGTAQRMWLNDQTVIPLPCGALSPLGGQAAPVAAPGMAPRPPASLQGAQTPRALLEPLSPGEGNVCRNKPECA